MRVLFLLAALFLIASARAEAQSTETACSTDTAATEDFLSYWQTIAELQDTKTVASRRRYGLSDAVTPAQVTLERDPAVCAAAVSAYERQSTLVKPGRRVLVIRYGDRAIVIDPDQQAGEYTPTLIFTDNFSRWIVTVMS